LPTGTTATTQTAGDNTTKLATTAFVTAAVPAFATSVQSQAGTSTTTAINPSTRRDSLVNPNFRSVAGWGNTGVSGTGAATTGYSFNSIRCFGPNSALAGYSVYRATDNGGSFNYFAFSRGKTSAIVDYSKPYIISFKLCLTTSTGNTIRFKVGQGNTDTGGDPGVDGFGIRVVGTGAIELQCYKSGVGLVNVTSSFTPTTTIVFDVVISSNNGTVLLYINDNLVATNTNGPISSNNQNDNLQLEVVGSGSQTANGLAILSNAKIFNGV
jgi:hypothetical protein